MEFSIIVAIYNVEKYLGKCLDSLKPLTYRNFEIIFVDDGSTDKSLSMVEQFLEETPPSGKCKIISQRHAGLSSARNIGLDNAKGNYVIFVDGDDYINPIKLLELCQHVRSDVDVTICPPSVEYLALSNFKESDKRYFSLPFRGIKQATEVDPFSVPAVAWSKLYKLETIKRIKLRFPLGLFYEDNYWHWMFMKNATSIFFSDISFYNYVRRPGSIMSNTIAKHEGYSIQRILVLDRILTDCKNLSVYERKKLIKDFLNGALSDCPKKERFKLFYFMQELLKKVNEEELSPFYLDVKNGNFKIEREKAPSISPTLNTANHCSNTSTEKSTNDKPANCPDMIKPIFSPPKKEFFKRIIIEIFYRCKRQK